MISKFYLKSMVQVRECVTQELGRSFLPSEALLDGEDSRIANKMLIFGTSLDIYDFLDVKGDFVGRE